MTRYAVGLALILVLVGPVAWANTPPLAEGSSVITFEGAPVSVELRAHDPDIDPLNPGAHPLRFVLVDGPSHGALIGDLGDVRYEAPAHAVVGLTYVPVPGFVGTDRILFAVFDPHEATSVAAVQITVSRPSPPPEVSGQWEAGMTWLPETGELAALATTGTVAYRVGGLLLKGRASFRQVDLGGGKQVVLERVWLEGDVRGEGITLSSVLAFRPQAVNPFDYLTAAVRFSLGGVAVHPGFHLTLPLASSFGTLRVQGTVGPVGITHAVRFNLDPGGAFTLARSETVASWQWCNLNLSASFLFTKSGFGSFQFSLGGVPLSELLPGYLPGLILDIRTTYTVEGKEVQASVNWRPPWEGCIRLFGGLGLGGPGDLTIQGAALYGLRIECLLGNVRFVSATSFLPERNSLITGQTDYWEVVRVSGILPGCCAKVPGSWSFSTYFYASGTQLFGWGMTTAALDLWPYDALNVGIKVVLRSGELGDPRSEVAFAFAHRW